MNKLVLILVLYILWFLVPTEHVVEETRKDVSYQWSISPALNCFTRDGKMVEVNYQMTGSIIIYPEVSFEEFVFNYIESRFTTELTFDQMYKEVKTLYPEYELQNITIVK